MKRALRLLGVGGLILIIIALAVGLQLFRQRATRLDRALMESEARVMQLETELKTATDRLAALTPTQKTEAAQAQWVRYNSFAAAGITNRVRIEGTSSLHLWQVEANLLGGSAEFADNCLAQKGAAASPGPLQAKVSVFIPVRSLKSVEKDGSHYSDAMDEIMYGKLLAETNKRITYTLTALTLKQPPPNSTAPLVCEAVGNLTVAGETKSIIMPVTITRVADDRLQFTGSVRVKMTDFKITPPAPKALGVEIKTGDDVMLSFSWWVKRAAALADSK